jgi:hypothetical protein
LTKRGKAILKKDFEKVSEINEYIIKLIASDEKQKYSIPNACFITFKTPIGSYTAIESNYGEMFMN